MKRKNILITASVLSAVIASSSAATVIAQPVSPPIPIPGISDTNQDKPASEDLKQKFDKLYKEGQDKAAEYINNSSRKGEIVDTPAEELITQLHVMQSVLRGINENNPDNRTYFEIYVYPQIIKMPKITEGSGTSDEAKVANDQLMKIPASMQNLMLKLRVAPADEFVRFVENELETIDKLIPLIDKYVNIEGGPTITAFNAEKEDTTSPTTSKETPNDKQEDTPTEEKSQYEKTLGGLKDDEVIFQNVAQDTLPEECVVDTLQEGWDAQGVKNEKETSATPSSTTSAPAPASATEESEATTTTPTRLYNRTTSAEPTSPTRLYNRTTSAAPGQFALDIENTTLTQADALAAILDDETIKDKVIDVTNDKFTTVFKETTIKEGEKDVVVDSSCINEFFDKEDSEDTSTTATSTTETTTPGEEADVIETPITEENSETIESTPSEENDIDVVSDNLEDDPVDAPNPTLINSLGDLNNEENDGVEENDDETVDEESIPDSSEETAVEKESSSTTQAKPSKVVGTQPGQYSPSGARVIGSSSSTKTPKKGYWNGSRYVSEEEFLKGGVSSSYSGFENGDDNDNAKKKVGPSVDTGGQVVKQGFLAKLFGF